MSNLIQESRLLRKVQEKVTGISADFPLPTFARETFPRWFRAHQPAERAGEQGDVVIFATCYGNFNTPEVPKAAVQVLEHVGYRVNLVEETCCGMPNLDGGDVDGFVGKVRRNVEALLPFVREGCAVLVPSPTCGYTMKREWAEYVPEPEVREVGQATRDLMEFLEELRRAKALPPASRSLGKVAYHAACHLRAQKIGFPGMRLLGKLAPDTEVRLVQECSAVDGTWGMKAQHYDSGRHYARKLVAAMEDDELDAIVTDCGLSALRIGKETGHEVLHPIQALAAAYEL